MKQSTDILHENDLVRTSCREEIINAIVESSTPLSEEEVNTAITGNFDRTTFYCTFKTPLTNGIIHKIVIVNTLVKYAITEKQKQTKQHAHFYCLNCNKVFCIPEVSLKYTRLPEGYKAKQEELLEEGFCPNCN